MAITGEIISRAGERTARVSAVASRGTDKAAAFAIDAHRHLYNQVNDSRGKADGAAREVARLEREAADLQQGINDAQAELERTGRRDPELAAMRFASSQSGEVIEAARKRADVARAALANATARYEDAERRLQARAAAEAEVDRLAAEREAAVLALAQKYAGDKPLGKEIQR